MSTNGQRTAGSFWSFLLVKGPAGVLLNLLALIFIPFMAWALTGWLTGDESTANAFFVVVFAAIAGLLLFRFVANRRSSGKGGSKVLTILMLLSTLVLLALLTSAHSSAAGATATGPSSPLSRSWGEPGGVDWQHFDPPNLRYLPGCTWAKVWHTGHWPALAFRVVYRVTLRVDWCWDGAKFTSVRIRFGPTKLTEAVDYLGAFKENWVTRYETCPDYNGVDRRNYCLYLRRAAKVHHDAPFKGKLVNAYPWVSIRISADRDVRYWNYSSSLW